ncbi:hypothetical protein CryarDRAFT_1402 [Cryptosporangium arvum DSM 44712]|uniref:Uncharacterized protein n=1 Tax=Cryptosporangium arvum DSM 44712 TaxID=927661 RepID=A0A011AE76_9ACTN|nr:hypothetical protein CryarDRAFT_1402 [Cryptosporangium arvum DSM 44712]
MLAAGVSALVVLVWFVAWIGRDEPDEVVRDYLEALSAGRTAEALDISRAEDVPTGPFLRREALSRGWTIDAVETPKVVEGGIPDFENEDVYSVAYRLGGGHRGEFRLAEDGWSWRIDDPLVSVPFWPRLFSFLQIGPVRVPLRPDDPTTVRSDATRFWMFPGVYTPYANVPSTALAPKNPRLIVTDQGSYDPEFTVTAAGNRTAQAAVDAVLDDCVALRTAQCTMAPWYDSRYDTEKGLVDPEDVTTQRWRIVRRPAISVRDSRDPNGTDGPLETYVVTPGVLRLDATGLDRDYDPVGFAQTCEINKFRLPTRLSDAGVLTFPRDGDPVHVELKCTSAEA